MNTEVNAPQDAPMWDEETPGPSGFLRRYRVIEERDGFRVEGRDRRPVFVRLSPGKASLLIVGDPDDIGEYDEGTGTCDVYGTHCSLYGYRQLLAAIATYTMRDWSSPLSPSRNWGGVHAWALGRSRRALHFRGVFEQWQRLLSMVPGPQRAVTKAVFAATFDAETLGCETWPALYGHPYLVEDIRRFRAAAIACHFAQALVDSLGDSVALLRAQNEQGFAPGPVGERAEALVSRHRRLARFGTSSLTYVRGQPALQQEIIELLATDWKALFSCNGRADRSLRRTLMNLPGSLSGRLVCVLPRVDHLLTRPITDRLELLALLLFGRDGGFRFFGAQDPAGTAKLWEGLLYAKASRRELLAALRLLGAHLQRELRPKQAGVVELVGYVRDYCQHCDQEGLPAHTGNIVGLTDRAIRWHRRVHEEEIKTTADGLADSTPLALPPVALPVNPAIRFLANVADLRQESFSMRHCIASYAKTACEGGCFLFHVDYKGTSASVEVWRNGEVAQSHGPGSGPTTNAASIYGRRVLSRWGKRFAQAAPQELPADPFAEI